MTFISFLPNYKFVLVSCKIFEFLNFHVSHLNYKTFKLCLQNTLNMSKMTRVYFGVLQKKEKKKKKMIKRQSKVKKKKRKMKKGDGRVSVGERGEREEFFFPLLYKIYGNQTVGFRRSKRQSWSTHRELRVGTKILEFRQTSRGREFSYLGYF